MSKVPSIEEFMETHREACKKKAKKSQAGVMERIELMKNSERPDWTEEVLYKIEKDGLSYSSLKKFRVSPMSYIEHIVGVKDDPTPAMELGTLLDVCVTEPETFDEKYFVMPEPVSRRSNEGKAIAALYEELAEGKRVIEPEELDEACNMVRALYQNDQAKYYLENMGETQKKITWRHKKTGIKLRGVLDWESTRNEDGAPDFFVDLKTAADAGDLEFPKKTQDKKLWYPGQLPFYALYYKSRWQFPQPVWIAVETSKPYNVNVFKPHKDLLEIVTKEIEDLLVDFKYCLDKNLWHKSYDFLRDPHAAAEYRLPAWYKPKNK